MWWVVATEDETQFIGWSCSQLGPLEEANIYRSKENAEKKIKQMNQPSNWPGVVLKPMEVLVVLK
jgi:hypothetical protein